MGLVIVGCEYDRAIFGLVNPKTGKPCKAHERIHIVTDEGLKDEALSLIQSINASRGWIGDTYVKPLFKEGCDG